MRKLKKGDRVNVQGANGRYIRNGFVNRVENRYGLTYVNVGVDDYSKHSHSFDGGLLCLSSSCKYGGYRITKQKNK